MQTFLMMDDFGQANKIVGLVNQDMFIGMT